MANDKIAENDYNLSVSSYAEQKDTREKIDIKVLNAEIEQIVAREQILRDEIANIFAEGKLSEAAAVSKMEIVQQEGKRQIEYYSLDVIISVGYRGNSKRGHISEYGQLRF